MEAQLKDGYGVSWTATNFSQVTSPPSTAWQIYRKPHDLEIRNYDHTDKNYGWQYMGDGYRSGPVRRTVTSDPVNNPQQKGMPEVYRIYPDHVSLLPCHWVWFWRNLNYDLSDEKWSTLMGSTLAWMNKTGSPPRKNCVLNSNMSEKDPAFHAPILNGGATCSGIEVVSVTEALRTSVSILKEAYQARSFQTVRADLSSAFSTPNRLNISGYLTSQTPPDLSYREIAKAWVEKHQDKWYWGTTVIKTGQVNYIVRLSLTNTMIPVRIPILSRLPLYAPLSWFHKMPLGSSVPDAKWMAE